MKKCSYTYKGKTYSQVGIKSKLTSELPINDMRESVEWLSQYLGMDEKETIIVSGLIKNKALGKLVSDGKILLSNRGDITVAKHEAFHRVWRFFVPVEERTEIIREFKKQHSDWKDLIKPYEKLYLDSTESELIEEYFADEFSDFNDDTKTWQPIHSWFTKLKLWLKKLLGLTPKDVTEIYQRINNKEYKNLKPQGYVESADKIIVGGKELTLSEKNDIVSYMVQQFVSHLINSQKELDETAGKLETLTNLFYNEIGTLYESEQISEDLAQAVLTDIDSVNVNSSVLIKDTLSRLENLGLKVLTKEIESNDYKTEADSKETQEQLDILDEDVAKNREFITSVKIDPKSGLSTKIKLLLSSFKTNELTESGLPRVVTGSEAFNHISQHLKNIPTTFAAEHILKIEVPYKDQLLKAIGYENGVWSSRKLMFRNEFFSKLCLAENRFFALRHDVDEKSKANDIYFFDLNTDTALKNKVKEWNQDLYLSLLEDDVPSESKLKELKDKLIEIQKLKNAEERNTKVLAALKIEVSQKTVKQVSDHVSNIIATVLKTKTIDKNVYKSLAIEGRVNEIARLETSMNGNNDTMITVAGQKIYNLGLNTQQTIVINKVKYVVKRAKENNLDVRSELLKYVPEAFNKWTVKGDRYTNLILSNLINGDFELTLPYVVQTSDGDLEFTDKLNEPDLLATHIAGALTGHYMSMKHSDRSTFFAYKFAKPLYTSDKFDKQEDGINIIANELQKQVEIELEFAKTNNTDIQYIGKDNKAGGYMSFLSKDRVEALLNGDTFSTSDLQVFKDLAKREFDLFLEDAKRYQILKYVQQQTYTNEHSAGISDVQLSKFIREGQNPFELALMAAFTNEVVFHIHESRFFTGDNRMFKNVPDLFKRLATQSSNGLMLNVDQVTNDYIRKELDQTYEVYDITTGKTISINTSDNLLDDEFRSMTLAESEDYISRLMKPSDLATSKLGIKNPSMLQLALEYGELQDNPNPTEKQKKHILSKIESAIDKYSNKLNENDGQSYMTLPAFKNYMNRLGKWTDAMDVAYQIEMALLKYKTLDEAKNMSVTIKGNNRYANVIFKPFQIEEGETWREREDVKIEALHTLKTQYAGIANDYKQGLEQLAHQFFAVFKTSQHLLQPSAIMGTNLHALNNVMLESNTQIVHMGSANKVGGVDAKLAATRQPDSEVIQRIRDKGLHFYHNGAFDHESFREASNFASYTAKWEYLKDQVNIGNKEKTEIKGSTQSLKLMLANMFINGQARFEDAVNIVSDYKQLIEEMVSNNAEQLFKEIGWTGTEYSNLDELRRVVLNAAKDQSDNIKNEINNFFDNTETGLEFLPMRQKIENVLYALVTRNIIDFNRPGNSYPQAPATGYEPYGKREEFDGKHLSQELDFYEPVFDSEGNVIAVKPAEVVLPLPTKWIPTILRESKTNNLIDALNWINAKLKADKDSNGSDFIVKGLRIPNQQLSSNDIFRIKKFTLPTVQAYAIVPSEIVVKVGSDFDIDKENIFWREDILNIIKGKPSKEMPLNDRLLEMERDILLHPRNIHHLLMPLTNDIFVGELYNKEFVGKKYIKPDKDDLISILNPALNVKKAIIFVKGKFAVGIGAKGITFHVLNQINTASPHIGEFLNLDPKAEEPRYLSTKLRFDGVEGNRFGNYVDTDGNLISEIMSQLLTMYVDGVKEPYAVLMNITMQTANVVDYLIKAGLSAKDITFFLSQPLIKDYLLAQKSNESLFIKNSKKEILVSPKKGKPYNKIVSRELSKKELLSEFAGRFYDKEANFGILDLPADWKVNNLEEGLKLGTTGYANKDFYKNQMYMLQHFLEIVELSKAYGNFTKTQDSDTRGFADIQDIIEDRRVRAMVEQQGMVDLTDVYDMTGLVSPFYKYGRKSYENLFEQFYSLLNSNNQFSTPLIFTKNNFAEIESALNKDKVMSTLDNDFMVFLVQNLYFNQDDFLRLTSGDDSVAKRVKKLKQVNPSNLFLKNLQPVIGKVQDPISGKRLDQVRLYEKQLDGLSTNEISKAFEEIYELDQQLYEDLIHLNFFQNGFNKGIFNYLNTVPTGRLGSDEHLLVVNKIQTEVINKLKEINQQDDLVKELFTKFVKLFDRNNLQFVPKNRIRNGHTLLKRNYFNGQSTVLAYFDTDKRQDEDGKVIKPVPILNNRNFKRYHIGFLQSRNNVTNKDLLNQAFGDTSSVVNTPATFDQPNSQTVVDKSMSWEQLKDLPVYSDKGVMVMRKQGTNEHFGNPFTGSGVQGLIQTKDVSEAVKAYEDWLKDDYVLYEDPSGAIKEINEGFKKEQRQWILSQIEQGKLNGQKLLYMKDKGEYYSHADALVKLVKLKTVVTPNNNTIQKIKIISGGQFGGDYGGLLAAKELGLETGGIAPKGFKVDYTDKRSVYGTNKDLVQFGLVEDSSSDYPSRTMKNVDNSDGTIAFMWGPSVGTSKTIGYAQIGKWVNMIPDFTGKPVKQYLVITTKDVDVASKQIREFVEKNNINILNIAGHRETSQPGIEMFVKNSLVQGLTNINITKKQDNNSTQLSLFNNAIQKSLDDC